MQMGPMIDMVFLLLVFFMVTAKSIKQESDISLA
ncbi:MAG: biopolymer transporter ExbD, partial [Verrucomicrobiales bacterium]